MKSKIIIGLLSCLIVLVITGSALIACKPTEAPTAFNTYKTILGLETSGNELWATTSSGVIRWDLTSGNQRKYTTRDGLGSNSTREIIRDSRGNIWVTCNNSGVSRFDGEHWDTFNVKNGLCSDGTISIAADKKGGVWVSAYWGVSYFDGKQWTSYSDIDPNASVIGGPNPMKDCQNLTHVDAELGAADVILVDSRGDVWFSSRGRGVTRYDGKEWKMFTDEDGLAKGDVSAIMEDKDGGLWFGVSAGASRFDGTKFQNFINDEYQSIIPRVYIEDLLQDSQGNIWVAAWNNGVARFDGNRWQTFRTKDGLPSDNAQSLFLDKHGYTGVITDKGVGLFDGSSWRTITTEKGLPKGKVRVVVTDDKGNLWFGGERGVSCYDK